MNRATYWSCLALMVGFIAVFRTPSATSSALGVMFGMSAFRLHDIGRSGKWALPPLLTAFTAIFLPLMLAGTLGLASATLMVVIFTAVPLVILGLVVWLGSLPGEPHDNRFGQPPGPGVTWIRSRPQPHIG